MRVVFVGGCGRSGSTLLERLLGALPGCCPLGEVALLWQRVGRYDVRCGCGARFAECEFWAAVGQAAFGGWHRCDTDRVRWLHQRVGRNRRLPRLRAGRVPAPLRRQIAEYADYYQRVYTAAAEVTGAQTVIDSSKNPGLAGCLATAGGLDLRIVHLIRDPRGFAHSSSRHVPRPETGGAAALPRHRPAAAALLWNAQNAAVSLLAGRGVPVHRSRYENLVADPRAELRAIAGFADHPVRERDLDFLSGGVAELGPIHSAAGNPMRFTTGRVPVRLDDAWRTGLRTSHRRLVAAACAPLLVRYGYPLRVPMPPAGATTVTEEGTACE